MENIQSFDSFNEEKKWIQDAVKHPGSLRKSLHKKKGEKITKSEIGSEVSKLRKKDRDKDKPGLQLGKNDRKKYRKLVLAKTLKSMNEEIYLRGGEPIDKFFWLRSKDDSSPLITIGCLMNISHDTIYDWTIIGSDEEFTGDEIKEKFHIGEEIKFNKSV